MARGGTISFRDERIDAPARVFVDLQHTVPAAALRDALERWSDEVCLIEADRGNITIAAPTIVPWLAPGLGAATGRERELTDLAVHLTRLMLLSPLFFGISGMLTGILNARQHFLAPALAPLIYNLSIIFAAIFAITMNVADGVNDHAVRQIRNDRTRVRSRHAIEERLDHTRTVRRSVRHSPEANRPGTERTSPFTMPGINE